MATYKDGLIPSHPHHCSAILQHQEPAGGAAGILPWDGDKPQARIGDPGQECEPCRPSAIQWPRGHSATCISPSSGPAALHWPCSPKRKLLLLLHLTWSLALTQNCAVKGFWGNVIQLSSADQLRVDRSSPSPGWPLPSTLSKSFPQTKPHRRLTLEAYWLLVLSSCIPYSFLKISLGLWLSAFWRMKGGESTLSWVMAWGIQVHSLIRASCGVCWRQTVRPCPAPVNWIPHMWNCGACHKFPRGSQAASFMNLCPNRLLVSQVEAPCFCSTSQAPADSGSAQRILAGVSCGRGVSGSAACSWRITGRCLCVTSDKAWIKRRKDVKQSGGRVRPARGMTKDRESVSSSLLATHAEGARMWRRDVEI